MGLVYDVNKSLGMPNSKADRVKFTKKMIVNGFMEEDLSETEDDEDGVTATEKFPKGHVVDGLEKDSKEYRESKFRLPKGVVKFVSYLIDKYGLNYKQMAKDIKNYDQETWRQLRAKCRKFMSITDHFSKYLAERDLVDTEIDPNDPRWQETNSDLDD
jgi:Ribosome biogenesis protein Nop16